MRFTKPIVAGLVCGVTSFAHAQQVTLSSPDRTIDITGELIAFEDGVYTLETTALGRLNIRADAVECSGEGCPALSPAATNIRLAASGAFSENLLNQLLASRHADAVGSAGDSSLTSGEFEASFVESDGRPFVYNVKQMSTTNAIRDFIAGETDIVLSTRELRQSEASRLARSRPAAANEDAQAVLALDGLMIVVAPDNPIQNIRQEDIARVFSGEIANWAELGGNNMPIRLYTRPRDSGTGFTFENLILRPERARLAANAQSVQSDAEISNLVSQDIAAIGFTSFSASDGVKPLSIRGVCGIQTPANAFTIKTEEYPFTRRLYVYSASDQSEETSDLADFISSDTVQPLLSEAGFVDQTVSALSVNEQGLRLMSAMLTTDVETSLRQLRDMTAELNNAERLSITFRFAQSSTNLDERGQSDVERLVRMISDGAFDRKEIILSGFTDSVGSGPRNEVLSLRRADQVRAEVLAQLPTSVQNSVDITTVGFGEISPLGCNDNFNGRGINRRVEVWVRETST